MGIIKKYWCGHRYIFDPIGGEGGHWDTYHRNGGIMLHGKNYETCSKFKVKRIYINKYDDRSNYKTVR